MPTVPPPFGTSTGNESRPVASGAASPPPGGRADDRAARARTRARFVAGTFIVLSLAAIAGLSLALLAAQDNVDNEKAKVAQAQASLDAVTGATATTASGPIDPTLDPSAALQTQLNQANAALVQAATDLANEKSGRAADAAPAQAATEAAAEAAAAAATDAAAVQAQQAADVAAAQQQLAALQALFPVTQAALIAANPTGQYSMTLTPGECTLAICETISPVPVDIVDPATITGERTNGALTFDGTTYSNSGAVGIDVSPRCVDVRTPSTYALTFQVTAVEPVDGVLQATQLAGTYTETITAGDCAGQHRSYTVGLARQ